MPKSLIQEHLNRINQRFATTYEIDRMAGGVRITTKGGSRNVSPRLPVGRMANWLDGFETALDEQGRRDNT